MVATPISKSPDRWQTTATKPVKLCSLNDVLAFPDPEWLIEGLLPKNGFAVLYGKPASGKSFLALDWGTHVSMGKAWHEREVAPGPVVYFAGEGGGGLKFRIQALLKERDLTSNAPFYFYLQAFNLFEDDAPSKCVEVLDSRSCSAPSLIVFDTLARCAIGADENSSKDIGKIIRHIDEIRAATGAAVLVVHHSGKNDVARARGSSALEAAVDAMFACSAVADGNGRILEVEKQKDAEIEKTIPFTLRSVSLANGHTSCVISMEEAEVAELLASIEKSSVSDEDKQKQCNTLILVLESSPNGLADREWKEKACSRAKISESTYKRRKSEILAEKPCRVHKEGSGKGARFFIAKSANDDASGSPGSPGPNGPIGPDGRGNGSGSSGSPPFRGEPNEPHPGPVDTSKPASATQATKE